MMGNRRTFLKTSLASSTLVAMGSSTVPAFLSRSALAAESAKKGEQILVVVQLLGGNDGLNTVVPHGVDGYSRARRILRLPASQIQKITPEIGLHPAMSAMARLAEKGKVAIVQGVGYPNPDRSHFRSMEIWESATLENNARSLETGWLGRALDAQAKKTGADPMGLHVARARSPWRCAPRKPRSRAWKAWKVTSSRSREPTRSRKRRGRRSPS